MVLIMRDKVIGEAGLHNFFDLPIEITVQRMRCAFENLLACKVAGGFVERFHGRERCSYTYQKTLEVVVEVLMRMELEAV